MHESEIEEAKTVELTLQFISDKNQINALEIVYSDVCYSPIRYNYYVGRFWLWCSVVLSWHLHPNRWIPLWWEEKERKKEGRVMRVRKIRIRQKKRNMLKRQSYREGDSNRKKDLRASEKVRGKGRGRERGRQW